MRTPIHPGNVIDAPTREEMRQDVSGIVASHFQELARGITPFRFDHTDTISAGTLRIPAAGEQIEGPRAGFVWQIGSVRAFGLAAADVLNVWRNNPNEPRDFIGQLTGGTPVLAIQKLTFFKGGEKLVVTGTGLTATGDITVNGEGVEVAELDLYKLI